MVWALCMPMEQVEIMLALCMSIEYVDSYMDRHESNTETQDWYGEMVWALCMPMEQVKI